MAMALSIHPDRAALAAALADAVAGDLAAAVAARGRAALAVPGGTTPGPFLARLGQIPLPWERVTVTLSDERWVPADHPRSNHRLLAATLLAGAAAAARVVPLFDADAAPADAARRIGAVLAADALPFDALVLGMGDDLHTASLFPGAEGLAAALDPADGAVLLPIRAPADGERRLTLTAPVLRGARAVHLLIQGPDKRAALDRALAAAGPEEAPVRVVLDRPGPTTIWYAD